MADAARTLADKPTWGDGVVPKRPAGWTPDTCTHVVSLDLLEQAPTPGVRGTTHFRARCAWGCGQAMTLDQFFTLHLRRLGQRLDLAEDRANDAMLRARAVEQRLDRLCEAIAGAGSGPVADQARRILTRGTS